MSAMTAPARTSPATRTASSEQRQREAEVHKAFSKSILISATRCVLTYVVLPFVAPLLGLAKGVGPWIGIPLGLVAIYFNVKSIRRFWAADHRWKWAFTVISSSVIVLLVVLLVEDLADLFT